ncbi:MAG: SDR family oxidoreductase [Gammaproteobacteria bacterium]|jgi:NAD(P)-dependent dehydrogenase (short-subunit alcohol dehydrogenase family)|nr:SDR family oxidoreductase [Gammaproteobacteria bacterium]
MTKVVNENFQIADLFSLSNKTALITGGSSGLGLVMAKGLLQNGAKVVIASRRKKKCDLALEELKAYGEVYAFSADVTQSEPREKLLEFVDDKLGSLSILLNNAGANWGASLEDYPDEGFAKVMDINLNAVFSLSRDAVPLLSKAASAKDPARIINIGSMDGIHVPIVQRVPTFAYSASKAALHHLTKAMAVELAPKQITVNAVAPGFFESRMTDYIFEHYLDDIEDDCPLHRIGQPQEIIGIVAYLASKAGSYTNGAVIPVDGGTSISKGQRDWMS